MVAMLLPTTVYFAHKNNNTYKYIKPLSSKLQVSQKKYFIVKGGGALDSLGAPAPDLIKVGPNP